MLIYLPWGFVHWSPPSVLSGKAWWGPQCREFSGSQGIFEMTSFKVSFAARWFSKVFTLYLLKQIYHIHPRFQRCRWKWCHSAITPSPIPVRKLNWKPRMPHRNILEEAPETRIDAITILLTALLKKALSVLLVSFCCHQMPCFPATAPWTPALEAMLGEGAGVQLWPCQWVFSRKAWAP